jgi:ribosomal-protein-serine acetyltransferase
MFRLTVDADIDLILLEQRDAPALFQLCDKNRSHLRRFLPWIENTHSEDDAKLFINKALQQFAAGLGFHAGIRYQGHLAGCIGLHEISRDNLSVSLGYWLDEAHQGRGVATAATRAVTSHCLGVLGLHRVEIRCSTANERSCAIPRRLGFHFEGTLRQAQRLPGGWTDIHVFSKLSCDQN